MHEQNNFSKEENNEINELADKITAEQLEDAFEVSSEGEKLPTFYEYNKFRFMWEDNIYKEWFNYAQLCERAPDYLSYQLEHYDNAEQWWNPQQTVIDFGEPLKEDAISVIDKNENSITININLNYDAHRLKQKLINLVNIHTKKYEIKSRAQFQPSKPMKNIRLNKLIEAREVYLLRKQGLTNLEIALELDFLSGKTSKIKQVKNITSNETYSYFQAIKGVSQHNPDVEEVNYTIGKSVYYGALFEAAERRISRHITAVNKALENIENGTFP